MAASARQMMAFMGSPYLGLALRLMVGGAFVVSGARKLPLGSEFVLTVKSYELLPDSLASAYGWALPWAELLVGAYLILGIMVRPCAAASVLMAVSFMVANVRAVMWGEEYCGSCFGETISIPLSQALALDVAIIVAALLLLLAGGRRQPLSFDNWFSRRRVETADSDRVLEAGDG